MSGHDWTVVWTAVVTTLVVLELIIVGVGLSVKRAMRSYDAAVTVREQKGKR